MLGTHDVPSNPALTVDDVLAADAWARAEAARLIEKPPMTALLYVLGVLVFVLAILASIGLHELGHMIPAKAFGGKVTQYFIGFGPTIWSRQRGETEYGIKAIPLGGYVKIVGMLPPDKEHAGKVEYDADGNRVVTVRKSNTGLFAQLISDARAAEWETITAADERPALLPDGLVEEGRRDGRRADGEPADRVLHLRRAVRDVRQPHRRGRCTPRSSKVEACVVPAAQDGRVCTAQDPVSPAQKAGLQAGDRFVSFNGTPINDWTDMQHLIRSNRNGEATIVVERDGRQVTLHTNTMVTPRPTDANDPTQLTPVGFLGVSPEVTYTTGGPIYTIEQMGGLAKQSAAGARHPAGEGVGRRPGDRRGQAPRGGQPGQRRRRRPARRRDRVRAGLPGQGQAGQPARRWSRASTSSSACSTSSRCCPLDGGHIAGALWEAPAVASPGCAAVPTPGTSTSPSSSRSRTSSPASCWSWASC